jgi:hypothetical protein
LISLEISSINLTVKVCLLAHLEVTLPLAHQLRQLATSVWDVSWLCPHGLYPALTIVETSTTAQLTELAPSLINPSSRSLSIISCSCPNARAYGIPNNNTLVDTTQRPFPVKLNAEPVNDAMDEDVLEILDRVEGGMISMRAATRSRSDSELSRSWSEATEISESRYYTSVSR